jgi:hypothetical protein
MAGSERGQDDAGLGAETPPGKDLSLASLLVAPDFIDSLEEGLIVQAKDGSIVDGNETALELLGLTREQLLRARANRCPGLSVQLAAVGTYLVATSSPAGVR